jgi:hypothetical protein
MATEQMIHTDEGSAVENKECYIYRELSKNFEMMHSQYKGKGKVKLSLCFFN